MNIASIALLAYNVLNLFRKKFFNVIDHVNLNLGVLSIYVYDKKNIVGLLYSLRGSHKGTFSVNDK